LPPAEVVAQNVDDLHSDNNKLGMQTSLTERGLKFPGVGYAPNRHDALTGSRRSCRFLWERTGVSCRASQPPPRMRPKLMMPNCERTLRGGVESPIRSASVLSRKCPWGIPNLLRPAPSYKVAARAFDPARQLLGVGWARPWRSQAPGPLNFTPLANFHGRFGCRHSRRRDTIVESSRG
jgi:hypothetical protein